MFTSLELDVTRTKFHDVFEESSIISILPERGVKREISVNAEDSDRPAKQNRIPPPSPEPTRGVKREISVNAEDSDRPEKQNRIPSPLPEPTRGIKRDISVNAEDSDRPEKQNRIPSPSISSEPETTGVKRELSVNAEDSDRPEKQNRIPSISPPIKPESGSFVPSDVEKLKSKMERVPGDREKRGLTFDEMKHVELSGNQSNSDLRLRSPFVSFTSEVKNTATRIVDRKSETSALLSPGFNFSFDISTTKLFDQEEIFISNERKLETGRETRGNANRRNKPRLGITEVKSIENWNKFTREGRPAVLKIELNKTSLLQQFKNLSDDEIISEEFEFIWDNSDFARLAFILVEVYGLSVELDGKMVQLFEPRRDLSSSLVKN